MGAAKAGTTALYKQLSQHPEVFFSPIKEPFYFAKDIVFDDFRLDMKANFTTDLTQYLDQADRPALHNAFVTNESDYLRLFEHAGQQKIKGEASVAYLYSEEAAKHIAAFNPAAKILLILRNPVDRAYSHYWMDRKMGLTNNNFGEAIENDQQLSKKGWGVSSLYVELGQYAEQVQRFKEAFPTEQVAIIWYEDFAEHPWETLQQIARFLGIDAAPLKTDGMERHNQAKEPRWTALQRWKRHSFLARSLQGMVPASLKTSMQTMLYKSQKVPVLSREERAAVLPYFEQDIKALSTLLGRNLNHWLTSDQ